MPMQLKNSFICKQKAALKAPNIFLHSPGLGGVWQDQAWVRVVSMVDYIGQLLSGQNVWAAG